jgi:hypothetical protein
VQVPVLCSLTSEGATGRIEEWRLFLQASVSSAERESENQLRLRLSSSPDVLLAAIALAQREKACCPFFEFSIDLQEDTCWFVVSVPTEAVDILTDFAGLVPSSLSCLESRSS